MTYRIYNYIDYDRFYRSFTWPSTTKIVLFLNTFNGYIKNCLQNGYSYKPHENNVNCLYVICKRDSN